MSSSNDGSWCDYIPFLMNSGGNGGTTDPEPEPLPEPEETEELVAV